MTNFNKEALDKAMVEIKHIFWEASRDYNCIYCNGVTKQLIAYAPFYEDVPICRSEKCIEWICNIIIWGNK